MGISALFYALFWAVFDNFFKSPPNFKGEALTSPKKDLEMSPPLKQVKKVSIANRITETNLYPILVL